MDLIYWSVRSSSRREGNGVKSLYEGIVILASYEFHFIRVYDYLVLDPSNNKSIMLVLSVTIFMQALVYLLYYSLWTVSL